MNKRTVSIISGAAGLVLAGTVYYFTSQFPARAAHAGQYVKFLTLVLAILSGLLILTEFKNRAAENIVWMKAPRYFTITAVLTVLYLSVINIIGFYIASALYILILAPMLGLKNRKMLFISAALLLGVIYAVFVNFLEVPVPLGILEDFDITDIPGSIESAKEAWLYL